MTARQVSFVSIRLHYKKFLALILLTYITSVQVKRLIRCGVRGAPPIGSSLSDGFYLCLLLLYPRYLLVIMVLVNILLLKSYLCLTLITGLHRH